MKCKIFIHRLTDNPEALEEGINKLLKTVDKIINITASPIGQGTMLVTIIYYPHDNPKKNRAGNKATAATE